MAYGRGSIIQTLIDRNLDTALYRNGVPRNSPMRDTLDRDAILSEDGRSVTLHDDRGKLVSIDERINQLKPKYGFAPDPPKPVPVKIDSRDWQRVRENFDAIARGEIIAE